MTLITDSQLTDSSTPTLCSYVNPTCDLQVIRIINVPNCYFEKVLFPKQRLLFETQPNAELEVYASQQGETVLVKKIPAVCLEVEQYSFH